MNYKNQDLRYMTHDSFDDNTTQSTTQTIVTYPSFSTTLSPGINDNESALKAFYLDIFWTFILYFNYCSECNLFEKEMS